MKSRRTRIEFQVIGWGIVVILGMIYFNNRNDLSVIFGDAKGVVYVAMYIIAVILIFLGRSKRRKNQNDSE